MKFYFVLLFILINCIILSASETGQKRTINTQKTTKAEKTGGKETTEEAAGGIDSIPDNNEMSDEELAELKNEVNTLGKKITAELKVKQMQGIEIDSNASMLKYWSENTNIENATNRNSEWYLKISSQLRQLAQAKIKMEVYEFHKMYLEYNEEEKNYDKSLTEYMNIIHQPATRMSKNDN